MKTKTFVMIAVLSTVAGMASSARAGTGAPGAVFTMNNASNGNEVVMFSRATNGALTFAGEAATGGLGTGAGLGNQGGVVLSEDHRWLFVVNAGSHEISVFAVGPDGITWSDKADSGGLNPVSLAVSGNLLYALNAGGSAGGSDNITGFTVSSSGKLEPLAGSTRGLSAAATSPAEVGFTHDGNVLIVTEKNTSLIDTYAMDDHGLAISHRVFQSAGTRPFGFALDQKNHLLVTEAPASAVSSYAVTEDGGLELISKSVPNHQSAACWMAVTKNNRFGFDANASANSVSGFRIQPDGSISLLNADGLTGATGAGPNDMALTEDGYFLYTVNTTAGSISVFHVESNGALTPGAAVTVPVGSNGLAAY
ncbi:MAG TPA: beta-propeller fold lactonase family protein [Verrucomicrobiae bacterium]|nr:beta-propeller fold lactonase family protein [Verrucomicrobiae bacterium]